jgi:Ca2+-binding RTX toxin-like protein
VTDPLGGSSTGTVNINVYEQRYQWGTDTPASINATPTGDQYTPIVAALTDGGYIAMYAGQGPGADANGVYGQRYDSSGVKVGGEFIINTTTAGVQDSMAASGLQNGGYVAVYDTGATTVLGRIFSSTNVGGAEFQINTTNANAQINPDVTTLDNGNFVVAWQSDQIGSSGFDIFARIYNSSGVAQTGEFRVSSSSLFNPNNAQINPSITATGNGGFVVVWDSGVSGNNTDIIAQRYDSAGVLQGTNFRVNTTTSNGQSMADVAALIGGGFVVTWQSASQDSGNTLGVYAQRYDSNGNTVGSETLVNTTVTQDQSMPSVIGLSNGGYFVAWISTQTGLAHVFGQEFDSSGAKVGTEFQISVDVSGSPMSSPHLAQLADGSIAVSWDFDAGAATMGAQQTVIPFDPLNTQTMTGGAGNDVFYGSDKNDTMTGNGGDDRFIGSGGGDTISGGAGTDTVSYENSNAGVTINLETGTESGGDAQGDNLSGIENLIGSNFNDVLTGDGGINRLEGGAGADQLIGGGGDDTLIGGAGNDTLTGGAGTGDTVSYEGSPGGVTVNLTTGTASDGFGGTDTISTVENIRGSAFSDSLTGSAGNNVIEGGAGGDTITGGGGSDTASYANSSAGVTINLLAGTATGGDAAGDTLSGISNLLGSKFADNLTGDNNANTLTGGRGNDTLSGGQGDDLFVFRVGDGQDTVYGGTSSSSGGNWIDSIQLADSTGSTGPVTHMTGANSDWTLTTSSTYTVAGNTLTFNPSGGSGQANASGSITLSDGSHINFTDIDKIIMG